MTRASARGGGGQRGARGERLFPHVALDGVQRLGVRGPVGARARLVQVVALPVRVHRDEHDAVPLAQAQVRVDEDEHLAQRDVEIAGDAPVLGVGLEHQHDRRPGGFRWVGRRGGTEVRRALERRSRDLALVSTRGRPRRERRENKPTHAPASFLALMVSARDVRPSVSFNFASPGAAAGSAGDLHAREATGSSRTCLPRPPCSRLLLPSCARASREIPVSAGRLQTPRRRMFRARARGQSHCPRAP